LSQADLSEKGRFYEVYILSETLGTTVEHCKSQVPYEAIGFLVGKDYRWLGKKYVEVVGSIRGKTKASEVRVEFDDGVMGEIVTELRQRYPGQLVVGWYHSHPGYGCFMSPTDIETQKSCFREPYHVALVVDPLQELIEFFKLEDDGQTYRPASFGEITSAYPQVTKEPGMIVCPHCNASVSPLASYCSMCGARMKRNAVI